MTMWGEPAGGLPGTAKLAATEAGQLTIPCHLRRLGTAYPAFEFSRESLGSKGARWVAEPNDRTTTGLRVMVTSDLMKLHAALQHDRADHAR